MKLKRRDLNRLIESLINEQVQGADQMAGAEDAAYDASDSKAATLARFGGPKSYDSRYDDDVFVEAVKELSLFIAEVVVGLTPPGVVIDYKDLSEATAVVIKSGGDEGKLATLGASVGFIPGMGDVLKGVFKRVFKSGKKLPAGLTEDMIKKMDPREIDDVIENNRELERLARKKLEARSKGVKSAGKASGKSTYLDELPAEEIQDKLNELPASVKEYMDVRLTKTKTMNGVSKSGNRIFNDTVPLQATAFEDMMDAYGNIPNKGKVNVGLNPIPAGSPADSVRLMNKKPGLELAPGDQVMVADGKYVHHEIVGITTDGERFGLLLKGSSKAGESAGKLSLVSNESAAEILSRYPGLVDEIVAKIIE